MSWPIIWPDPEAVLDPATKIIAELYAGACMYALTLQRVGGTPVTIRPETFTRRWWDFYLPHEGPVPFYVYPSALDLQNNTYRALSSIMLPGPVGAVTNVSIGGVALDPAEYQVINGRWLVRVNETDWPVQDGTFTVTYVNGYPVDEMGQRAGGMLAQEFYQAFAGGKNNKCRLPASITNVVRQGISYEIARGMFPDGLTGLPEIDAYLMLWNPHGLKMRPRVYSPDLPTHRQVTQ